MLIKLKDELWQGGLPAIGKTLLCENKQGEDVSCRWAFAYSEKIELCISLPRRYGVTEVSLRIKGEKAGRREVILRWVGSELGCDIYACHLSMAELCESEPDGLFFIEFVFFRGEDVVYGDTENNVDIALKTAPGRAFRLLVFRDGFETSAWAGRGAIYHIFVDRFRKGAGKVTIRHTQIINENWESGVPQYVERSGSKLENNVFFGGNLWGIIEKLDYIASLGITIIYLSPIFEAYSNHRYDTGDYEKIDGLLGGEEAFDELLKSAAERGIKIILDGVFNHTGDDSKYFDKYGCYGKIGAFSDSNSKYKKWFRFRKYPDSYECWWDIDILPRINPACAESREYLAGENGIAASYVRRGIGGWRLDVADELSDEFLEMLRKNVKGASGGDALIVGEVWENAADKVAYGKLRRYLRGAQLDSVMNYPVREAIIDFVLYRDESMLYNKLTEIYSCYPPCVCRVLMNLLSTHDTERILTVLADANTAAMSNSELAAFKLSPEQYKDARKRLILASVIQYTVFGIPSLFYGDEAGLEGGRDPFCRMPYPWGREDEILLSHYRRLGEIRLSEAPFDGGEFRFIARGRGFICYERKKENEILLVAANSTDKEYRFCPPQRYKYIDLLSGAEFSDGAAISVPPVGVVILKPKLCPSE